MTGRHMASRAPLRQRVMSGLVGDDPRPEPATPARVSGSGPVHNASVASAYERVARQFGGVEGALWAYLRGDADVVVGSVFEDQFRPVLKVERQADAVWVVSWMVGDEDFLGPLTLRELASDLFDGLPDDVLLSVKEKARHLGSVSVAPWVHDTCPECGWDGDAAVTLDTDQGLLGWECLDCGYFVVTRDLVDV